MTSDDAGLGIFGPNDWGKDLWRLSGLADKSDDRTVAIVYVSYLEKYLGEVLKRALPGLNSELRRNLFEPGELLGAFIDRAHIARGLGLLDADGHADYKLLASIRNKFAHNIPVDSFDNPEIAERIAKLRLRPSTPESVKRFFEYLAERLNLKPNPPAKPWVFDNQTNGEKFRIVCTAYVSRLYFRLEAGDFVGLAPSADK